MRVIRTSGSEGGAAQTVPTPIDARRLGYGAAGLHDPTPSGQAGLFDPTPSGQAGLFDPTPSGQAGLLDPTLSGHAGLFDPTPVAESA